MNGCSDVTGHEAQGQRSAALKPGQRLKDWAATANTDKNEFEKKKKKKEDKIKGIDFGKRSLLKVLPSDCSKEPFFLSSGHPGDVKCKVIVWPTALY